MERRQLGELFEVSVLSLGGGGIAQIWGKTSRSESVATVRAAYEAGITLFDVAPVYGNGEAEVVLGEAFGHGYPADARVLTKCMLGPIEPSQVASRLDESLSASLQRLRRDYVDILLLHGTIVPDERGIDETLVPLTTYLDQARFALDDLVQSGRVGAWGISALGPDAQARAAIAAEPHPQVIECTVNALYSDGPDAPDEERPHRVIEAAVARNIGVMGVRAVQRGALTDRLDRDVPADTKVAKDYARASGFRLLAQRLGWTASYLAYRYALSIPNVATIVLGVKNRDELAECLKACNDGALQEELLRETEQSFSISG